MESSRLRFFRQVAFMLAALIICVAIFAVSRTWHAQRTVSKAIVKAQAALSSGVAELTTPNPDRTGEERVTAARAFLIQGKDELHTASGASRDYRALVDSPLLLLKGIAAVLEPPASVPASLSSSVFMLSLRLTWRLEALSALKKLMGYDAEADVGTLQVGTDARELVRRLYLAKDGMIRVTQALSEPPFNVESQAVSDVRKSLDSTLGIIDPLIIALDSGSGSSARELLNRYLASAEDTRSNAETAYALLSSDSSLRAVADELTR